MNYVLVPNKCYLTLASACPLSSSCCFREKIESSSLNWSFPSCLQLSFHMYRTRWLKVLSVRLNLLFSFSLNWPKPNQSICCNDCLLFVCWSSLVNYALYIINPTCSDCSCHLKATVSSLQTTYKINRHLTKNHTKRRQTESLEILKKNTKKKQEKKEEKRQTDK